MSTEIVTHRNKTVSEGVYLPRWGQPPEWGHGRVLRAERLGRRRKPGSCNQQSLLRAILDRITSGHLLTNPLTAYHVVSAMASLLTVDSNFTNSEVESLGHQAQPRERQRGNLRDGAHVHHVRVVASQLVRER